MTLHQKQENANVCKIHLHMDQGCYSAILYLSGLVNLSEFPTIFRQTLLIIFVPPGCTCPWFSIQMLPRIGKRKRLTPATCHISSFSMHFNDCPPDIKGVIESIYSVLLNCALLSKLKVCDCSWGKKNAQMWFYMPIYSPMIWPLNEMGCIVLFFGGLCNKLMSSTKIRRAIMGRRRQIFGV